MPVVLLALAHVLAPSPPGAPPDDAGVPAARTLPPPASPVVNVTPGPVPKAVQLVDDPLRLTLGYGAGLLLNVAALVALGAIVVLDQSGEGGSFAGMGGALAAAGTFVVLPLLSGTLSTWVRTGTLPPGTWGWSVAVSVLARVACVVLAVPAVLVGSAAGVPAGTGFVLGIGAFTILPHLAEWLAAGRLFDDTTTRAAGSPSTGSRTVAARPVAGRGYGPAL